jgi:hypothetical protein
MSVLANSADLLSCITAAFAWLNNESPKSASRARVSARLQVDDVEPLGLISFPPDSRAGGQRTAAIRKGPGRRNVSVHDQRIRP